MRRALWIAGVSLLALGHARADDALPLTLGWRAPAECPSGPAVRAELERIARVRAGVSIDPLTAQVQVERRGCCYRLQLHTEHAGQTGNRELEAADCRTLVRALTLVLALTFGRGVEIDSDAGENSASRQREPSSRVPAAANAAATPSAAAVTGTAGDGRQTLVERDAPAALRWAVLAGVGLQMGLLPSAALALHAGAELSSGAYSLALLASAWPGSDASVAPGIRARFDGLAARLNGCVESSLSAVRLGMCAQARAAAVRGQSRGATQDGEDIAAAYALGASVSLTLPATSWLRVRIEAALALSLNRPRFVIDGVGEVRRTPVLAPDVGLLLLLPL